MERSWGLCCSTELKKYCQERDYKVTPAQQSNLRSDGRVANKGRRGRPKKKPSPKSQSKKVRGSAKAKARPKKSESMPEKAKPKAKAKAKSAKRLELPDGDSADNAKSGRTLGCSRCRYAALGCTTCKNPNYKPHKKRRSWWSWWQQAVPCVVC